MAQTVSRAVSETSTRIGSAQAHEGVSAGVASSVTRSLQHPKGPSHGEEPQEVLQEKETRHVESQSKPTSPQSPHIVAQHKLENGSFLLQIFLSM